MTRKKRSIPISAPNLILGQKVQELRIAKEMTTKKLAKILRETEQQIVKYENGAFIPMAKIEAISKALDERVQKKIIRKISAARKRELAAEEELGELEALYNEAFPGDYEV